MIFTSNDIESKLDAEILATIELMRTITKTSQEYGVLVERLSKLHKLKSDEKTELKLPSMDTVLIVAANVFGVVWLARFEKEHPIREQNAMRFVLRPR